MQKNAKEFILTLEELRRIVFITSVAYHNAFVKGLTVQEAEWIRTTCLNECLMND